MRSREVTELLKLLPELGRMVLTLCELHMGQLEEQPLPEEVKQRLREASPPTQTQMQLAIELAQEGQTTIRQLADRLGVTPAAVSLMVDRMVEHGWLERVRDERDRRLVWVRLTPDAQAMSEALIRVQREQIVAFLSEVPEEERRPFLRNLARFVRMMGKTEETGGPGRSTSSNEPKDEAT
jgi:MarR family transcriptional regulator, organic hydroperoxide resistance regulator